jgi:hypothetical protein
VPVAAGLIMTHTGWPAAAGELLERDPAFARRALTAIEETGGAAMEDLDHVLGLLRDERHRRGRSPADLTPSRAPEPSQASATRQPDLRDLGRLAAGAGAQLVTTGALGDVPAEPGNTESVPLCVSGAPYETVESGDFRTVEWFPPGVLP